MSETGRISLSRSGATAHLTLDNSARRNAITAEMWLSISAFCKEAAGDRDLRAVVISGAGNVFSAGADISNFDAIRSGSGAKDYDGLVETTVSEVEKLPQLVFAAVQGHCIGAGASLACACDFRICTPDAFFAVPAARIGLGYDPRGIARFVRIFGEPLTKEALLLAEAIPAERAFQAGAVHRLVPESQITRAVEDIAAKAATLAPLTQAAAKAAIRDLSSRWTPGKDMFALAAAADASEDYAEGRAAFAEKRPPNFKGR